MNRDYRFVGTADVIEAVMNADPDDQFINLPDPEEVNPKNLYHARRVTWVGQHGVMVKIPAENVRFMPENTWNFEHGAALFDILKAFGSAAFEAPPARVYRVDASSVKESQKYAESGELEEQLDLTRPWEAADKGDYYATLLDGNHRAAAALAAGEPYIYVYVSENYRENVRKKDFE